MADSSPTSSDGMPLLAFVLAGFMGLALMAEATVEPYPSITMPGFHRTAEVPDPAAAKFPAVRLEYSNGTRTLDAADLLPTAPVNQRSWMMSRLRRFTGTDAEWAWIDSIGKGGMVGRPTGLEFVLISRLGEEQRLFRVERDL